MPYELQLPACASDDTSSTAFRPLDSGYYSNASIRKLRAATQSPLLFLRGKKQSALPANEHVDKEKLPCLGLGSDKIKTPKFTLQDTKLYTKLLELLLTEEQSIRQEYLNILEAANNYITQLILSQKESSIKLIIHRAEHADSHIAYTQKQLDYDLIRTQGLLISQYARLAQIDSESLLKYSRERGKIYIEFTPQQQTASHQKSVLQQHGKRLLRL